MSGLPAGITHGIPHMIDRLQRACRTVGSAHHGDPGWAYSVYRSRVGSVSGYILLRTMVSWLLFVCVTLSY